MNKFTKIKKGLAVSLCASMLFSNKPKTSGMEILSQLGVGKKFFYLASAVAVVTYFKFTDKIFNSSDISKNIKSAKVLYNKLCYLIEKLKNVIPNNNNIKEHITACLKLAREQFEKAEQCRMFSFNINLLSFFNFEKSKELNNDSRNEKNNSMRNVRNSLEKLRTLINSEEFNMYVDLDNNEDLESNVKLALEKLNAYALNLLPVQLQDIHKNELENAGKSEKIAQVPNL